MKHTAILIILAAMLPFSRTILAQTSLEGSWSGDLKAGQTSITLVLNFVKGEDGELSCTLDSPDQGAKGIHAEFDASPSGQLTINIPSVMASWTGMLYRNSLTGTFTQMGQSLPLTFNKGGPAGQQAAESEAAIPVQDRGSSIHQCRRRCHARGYYLISYRLR